jgi:hypothetical protein
MKNTILILSILFLVVSCKTTRTITKVETAEISPVVQLIEKIQKNQPKFRTANVSKMSLELTLNERNVNVSATCKIVKDSAIYLSIQPFMGIEMFKAEFLPDSMLVIDKMNRKYYKSDYKYISKKFGVEVDFYSLQALIFNQFFCVGNKQILPDSCKLVTLSGGNNKIVYENQKMLQASEISSNYSIQNVVLKAKNSSYQLETTYNDFGLVNGVSFPQKISMLASNLKSKAICTFSVLKVEFDTNFKLVHSNTDRYAAGELEKLLKKE